jgi:hypothetical protein
VSDQTLPAASLAMLAIIVAREGDASAQLLIECVPYHPRRDAFPGLIPDWPHSVEEWFGDLQHLIDLGLVVRVATEHRYVYQPTEDGILCLTARMHPHGKKWTAVA